MNTSLQKSLESRKTICKQYIFIRNLIGSWLINMLIGIMIFIIILAERYFFLNFFTNGIKNNSFSKYPESNIEL